MAIFKCKMCGGTLNVENRQTTQVCEYCGTPQTLPRLDDERRAALYTRANNFRRNNEFDKAEAIYESILNEDHTDAEAYWSLLLCRYGVVYVEDPMTHKQVPTVNRAQFTSIYDDDNYRGAIEYADEMQRDIYEREASAINDIQRGILDISRREAPFDVFICYKETDDSGARTRDSVIATELYYELVNEGFKVFFSRITLEDKLGVAYEPYIFAALNSAKVMVVLGTRPEYFNAVWVKNEWSRFLGLVKESGGRKILIPAYRDMDPYDLPAEFSHLQAQDMSKLGFMQDLIRGIKKLTAPAAPMGIPMQPMGAQMQPQMGYSAQQQMGYQMQPQQMTPARPQAPATPPQSPEALLKRAFIFLQDGDFTQASAYLEKVLDLNPECAEAYLGKLMIEYKIRHRSDLGRLSDPFYLSPNYEKVMRYGSPRIKEELDGAVRNAKQSIYQTALLHAENKRFGMARELLEGLGDYEDAPDRLKELNYTHAISLLSGPQSIEAYEGALYLFDQVGDYRDASMRAVECRKVLDTVNKRRNKPKMSLKKKIIITACVVIGIIVLFSGCVECINCLAGM